MCFPVCGKVHPCSDGSGFSLSLSVILASDIWLPLDHCQGLISNRLNIKPSSLYHLTTLCHSKKRFSKVVTVYNYL